MNAVAGRFSSAATACIHIASAGAASKQTPAGFGEWGVRERVDVEDPLRSGHVHLRLHSRS